MCPKRGLRPRFFNLQTKSPPRFALHDRFVTHLPMCIFPFAMTSPTDAHKCAQRRSAHSLAYLSELCCRRAHGALWCEFFYSLAFFSYLCTERYQVIDNLVLKIYSVLHKSALIFSEKLLSYNKAIIIPVLTPFLHFFLNNFLFFAIK